MIFEIKRFVDNEGKQIQAKIPVFPPEGSRVEDKPEEGVIKLDFSIKISPEYTGIIGIPTPRGNMQLPFDFPAGYTLEECFSEFEKLATEKVEQLQKEMENQIIPASNMPSMPPIK